MRRLRYLIFLAVACSSSSAQEGHVPMQFKEPTVMASVIQAVIPTPSKPQRTSKRTSRLEKDWFTKVCVSEGGFNIQEAKALLQTMENMRGSKDSLLDVMYRQSARITRQKPFTDVRQIWISYLQMKGKEPPEKGWVECTSIEPTTNKPLPLGCTGTWSSTVDAWVYFRDQAKELYYSGIVPEIIDGKPTQWGGRMDYWRGVDHGLCPLKAKSSIMTKPPKKIAEEIAKAWKGKPPGNAVDRLRKMIEEGQEVSFSQIDRAVTVLNKAIPDGTGEKALRELSVKVAGLITLNDYWGEPAENLGKCLPIDQKRVKQSKVLTASIAKGWAMKRHLIPQLLGEDALIHGHKQGDPNEPSRAD